MGKHRGIKAAVLLVVIFFHAFVLVPKSYAGTVVDMAAARAVFRAVAPSVVAATPAGWGYWLVIAVQAGIIYMVVKSGAVTSLKNWLTGINAVPPTSGTIGTWTSNNGYTFRTTYNSPNYHLYINSHTSGNWPPHTNNQEVYIGGGNWSWIAGQMNYYANTYGGGFSALPAPTVPTDYNGQLGAISFGANQVFYSPGGADQLAANGGGGTIISAESKSDADLDMLKDALGMTSPDPSTGAQPEPNSNDNTITSDMNKALPLFQQMVNYLSNLIGIKSNTEKMVISLDNIAVSLANPAENPVNMDNVISAINAQSEIDNAIAFKLDNVIQSVEGLTGTESTQSSLTSRMEELQNLMATKFPFSFVMAVEDPGVVTGGTFSIPNIVMPMGHEIVVDPMEHTEIAAMISFVRGLVAIGMWAIFIVVLVRKVATI